MLKRGLGVYSYFYHAFLEHKVELMEHLFLERIRSQKPVLSRGFHASYEE
jgi:hypothetical protein